MFTAPRQDFRDRPKRRYAPHSKTLRDAVEGWDSVNQLFVQNVERLDRNPRQRAIYLVQIAIHGFTLRPFNMVRPRKNLYARNN